ncbi:MAG: hypothetical protein ACD_49C00037G0005 [uncultured bacterium (gcode 4)]|uniref:Uncharacterized protein n=1 Tax=uncultured bacterium (gcode 4) TaxID=1234023 RepID=K2AXN7_9BACT|nr:MAG: hypothetical protein ACD_49C00037G0005 [uncultured bacterium (gcode 4)]
MEETTNIAEEKQDSIFNELWDLDFWQINSEIQAQKLEKNYFVLSYKILGNVFLVGVIVLIILFIDIFLKSTEDNSLISALPIFCNYISYPIEWFDNTECKTLPIILKDLENWKNDLEKDIGDKLIDILPKKLDALNIASSNEVEFIKEKTGDSRISINEILDNFDELKLFSPYKWEDIECNNITVNEKWDFETTCDIYWWSLLGSSYTSRRTALDFLNKINQSNFIITDSPKKLEINKFSSSDMGIKWVFTTKTTLNLKLKYLPIKK